MGGDDWNGENFSWFSQRRALPASLLDYDQTAPTLDNGGRILRSVVRPYPAKTAGIPLRFEYEVNTGAFSFSWATPGGSADGGVSVNGAPLAGHPPLRTNVTEIFVPAFLAHGSALGVRGLAEGDSFAYDEGAQTLYVRTAEAPPGTVHSIEVVLQPRLRAVFFVNDFWGDWGQTVLVVLGVVLALQSSSRE